MKKIYVQPGISVVSVATVSVIATSQINLIPNSNQGTGRLQQEDAIDDALAPLRGSKADDFDDEELEEDLW